MSRCLSFIHIGALAGVVALALAGCDSSDGDFESDSSGTTTVADPSSMGPNSPSTTETEPGEETTGPETTEPNTTDPTQYCPCDWIDCGDAGYCEGPAENPALKEGMCICDQGVLELGHACFSCKPEASSGVAYPLDIDVRTIEGRVQLDDAAPPIDAADAGLLTMRDLDSGDSIALGPTTKSMFTARVATRMYDIFYSVVSNADNEVPDNPLARVRRVSVDFSDSPVPEEDLVANLRSTSLSGSIYLGQDLAPDTTDDHGRLFLRSAESGEEIALGSTSAQWYQKRVLRGSYEVIYEAEKPGALMPKNSRGVVSTVEVIADNPGEEVLAINIATVKLSGAVLFDDAPAPTQQTDYGLLYLRDFVTGALTLIGETTAQSYDLNVLPGTYDVIYSSVVSGGATPANKHARVAGPVSLGAQPAEVLDINIQTVAVTGPIAVNGVAPPSEAGDDGVISIEGVNGLGTVVLGSTRTGSYTKRVIAGEYDVFYTQETATSVMPQNTHARVLEGAFFGGLPVSVDIPVVTVTGSLTLSDGAEAISELEDGRVFLRDESVGDSVLLGALSQGVFARRVIPGTYTAHYSVEAGGAVVPANGDARIGDGLKIESDTPNLDVVVPVSEAKIKVTYNKNPPPGDKVDYGAIYLESVDTGDELYLGDTTEGSVSRRVVEGTYLIRYRHRVGGVGRLSPQNTNVALDCVKFLN